MKRELNLDERKRIQLEMLSEIHKICLSQGIRYSLAYGTLIGAIRHKGFIPWDDDVDIMMPYPDMIKFKEKLDSENLEYCDIDTVNYYDYPFSRIAQRKTFAKTGLIAKSYGVNIDLYPIVSIPREEDGFWEKASELQKKRMTLQRRRTKLIQILPITTIPYYNSSLRALRDFLLNSCEYGSTKRYYVVSGPIINQEKRNKEIYDFDLFDKLIEVDFEGRKFLSTAHYDEHLKQEYGDYMQLPPENERRPYHGGHYYWK